MAGSVDEKVLIARARAGDRAAFDHLVREHFPRVYAVAFRLVGNHEDAEDLAQECMVRGYLSLRWYRGSGAFSSWLYRIVVHLAHDRHRSAERNHPMAGYPEEPVVERGPVHELGRKELNLALLDSIRKLPDSLRTALVLRTLEGMDYAAIADATGFTATTIRTQVMKARRALLRLMQPYFQGSTR
ncbi:MAG: RNA polymerase sigma factor [Planctomycetota bacterium]|nr:RNA polymerase sigma factor [Planctomycetota bacterium]